MTPDARGPLRTLPALRVETVVRVRPFTVAYGVRAATAAVARDLAGRAGIVVPAEHLARRLTQITTARP